MTLKRPSGRITLTLGSDVLEALRCLAVRELRTTKAEAIRLLLDGLRREGALKDTERKP
jgi:hypothetical protein